MPQNQNNINKSLLPGFNSTSRAKPQTQFVIPPMYIPQTTQYTQNTPIQSGLNNSSSLNNDSYSGFFSGTSISQSESDENVLLSRQEIKLLKKQKVGCASGNCTICFEKYEKGQVIRNLPCGHKFHYKCMKPWLKTSIYCPLCRFDLKTYCSQKIDAQSNTQFLKNNQFSLQNLENGHFDTVEKKIEDSHSKTFIDLKSCDNNNEVLGCEEDVSAIQMENSQTEFIQNDILKNEEVLRFKVMGFETESNVSFFGKKQESKEIHFGIEDDISEIGL